MIPQGYKQTEIGIIPEDWECVMLPKILNEKSDSIKIGPFGSQLKKEYLLSDGEYCVYGQENIYANDFFKCYRFLTCERFQQLKSCEILPNDFLISTMGTIGKCAIAPFDIKKGIMDSHLLRLRFCSAVNKDFFKYYFSSDLIQQQIKILSVGGIMSGLSSRIVKNLKVVKINIAEQEKIAEALSDTDDLISSLEKLIEKKKAIKQGAMQNLLTGKTRFPGFNKQLENDYFKSFNIKIQKGQTITKSQLKEGCFPVVAGGRKPAYYCDIYNRDGETITISASGASAGFVNIYSGKIFASDCSTISESKDYDITYIYYLLLNQQEKIYSSQTGGAQPHIHPKDINNLKVFYTRDIKEQKSIAEILSDMDKEIEQLEQKLAKARLIKQGMMQQLLTGKIRLVD